MKKIFILFVVYLLVVGAAAADEERLVRKDATDLNEQELRLMAVDFFAVKCGLSKESLSEALMDIQLLQRGCKVKNANGRTQWQGGAASPIGRYMSNLFPVPRANIGAFISYASQDVVSFCLGRRMAQSILKRIRTTGHWEKQRSLCPPTPQARIS